MTNEQIEQEVRKVVGWDASPRKVQAMVWARKRFGPEWLKTYQQRQQRQPATARQRTSRQQITLDWADVEAWVKRQPHTSENWAVGGYYTDCPVSTHKTDDLISAWAGDDGGIGLKCWGGCGYSDIHKALTAAIKTSAPPVTDPQAAAETRIKELQAALAVAEIRVRKLQAEKSDWVDQLAAETRVRELEKEQSHLEKTLTSTKEELKRESAACIAAETDVQVLQVENTGLENRLAVASKARHDATQNHQELQAKNSSLVQRLTAAKGQVRQEAQQRADVEKQLAAANDELEQQRAAGVVAEVRVPKLQTEQSSLAKSLTAAEDLARQEAQQRADMEKQLAATKAEIERESAAREELTAEKADLTKQLTATKAEIGPTRAARIAAENYARTLQTEISSLKDKLAAASNVRQGVRAPSTLQMNGPLAGAWGLFSKDEPTYAFIDAMSVLELNLRRVLEREIVLDDDGLQYMLMTARDIDLISQERWGELDKMRQRRNRVMHDREELEMPKARDALDYLKPAIDQLRPARVGSQDLQRLAARWNGGR